MKKWLALAATAVLGASLLISGCGSSTNNASSSAAGSSKAEVLKVAANPVPHAEILLSLQITSNQIWHCLVKK